MTTTEITAKTLTNVITSKGLDPKDFNVKAALVRIAEHNEATNEGEYEGEYVDLETAIEWLDETGTKGNVYQLTSWA